VRFVKENLETHASRVPDFLSVTKGDIPEGLVLRLPDIGDASVPVQPQLIIELLSK
jgi:ribosomal protein S4